MARKGKKQGRKSKKEKDIHEELREMMGKSLNKADEMHHDIQKIDQGITDIKSEIKSRRRKTTKKSTAAKRVNNKQILEQIEKVQKQTDPSNKTQGVFDFTFALIIFTLSTLCYSLLISSETCILKNIFLTFTYFAFALGIFSYLLVMFAYFKKQLSAPYLNYLQIVLSTLVIILYLLIVGCENYGTNSN